MGLASDIAPASRVEELKEEIQDAVKVSPMIISLPQPGLLNDIFPISPRVSHFPPLYQATGAAVEEGVGQVKAPTAIAGTVDVDPDRLW